MMEVNSGKGSEPSSNNGQSILKKTLPPKFCEPIQDSSNPNYSSNPDLDTAARTPSQRGLEKRMNSGIPEMPPQRMLGGLTEFEESRAHSIYSSFERMNSGIPEKRIDFESVSWPFSRPDDDMKVMTTEDSIGSVTRGFLTP